MPPLFFEVTAKKRTRARGGFFRGDDEYLIRSSGLQPRILSP